MTNPTGEVQNGLLRLDFDRRVMIHFRGAVVTSDAGLLAIKIGAKVVSHGRYVTFQMAEVAIPRTLFAAIMQRIAALRSPPMATAA